MAIPKPLEKFLRSLKGQENPYLRIDDIELEDGGEYLLSTIARTLHHPGKPRDAKHALFWADYVAEHALLCISYHVLLRGDESLFLLIEAELEEYEGAHGFYFSTETGDQGCLISAYCLIKVDTRGRVVVDGDPKTVILDALVLLVDEWKKAYSAISVNLELESDAKVNAEHVYH